LYRTIIRENFYTVRYEKADNLLWTILFTVNINIRQRRKYKTVGKQKWETKTKYITL